MVQSIFGSDPSAIDIRSFLLSSRGDNVSATSPLRPTSFIDDLSPEHSIRIKRFHEREDIEDGGLVSKSHYKVAWKTTDGLYTECRFHSGEVDINCAKRDHRRRFNFETRQQELDIPVSEKETAAYT